MSMFQLSRREFLHGSAALAGAAAAQQLLSGSALAAQQPAGRVGGPNEQINVAVIGVHGRGCDHVSGFAGQHNCVVTHICDVDSAVIGNAMTRAERGQRRRPEYVQDLRRIMDNPSVHVVSIATPNHWHALAAIWAMQAGKDVYVEKPVSHNVWEGRRIVEVSRQTNRICQTGTQIRSAPGVREAIEFLRSGQLGAVRVARGLCYKRRNTIGQVGPNGGTVPATMNYDLWCGPAPVQRPLRRERLHYDWHWTWDYGNGDLGNQGIHQMDVARWGLGKNDLPRSVLSLGGRFGYIDDGQTANTQLCFFDYGDCELIFEVRGLPTGPYRGAGVGNIFHCANGYMVFPHYEQATAYDNDGNVVRRFSGRETHFTNFINAVRTRRRQNLNADILEGHLSSALCHLANISYRMGEMVPFNAQRNIFGDDRDASETFDRMRDHLRQRSIPLDQTNYRLGRRLTLNPRTERFVNNTQANEMLTRPYRRGFEVPART
jgi:predicted dehydrogenase